MIRYFLSLCILMLCSAASFAQVPVQVRSGEHGVFTRLTVQLPKGVEWRIDKQETELLLVASQPLTSIDVSSVFERIGRSRVTDVIPKTDMRGLLIALGCDCGFRSYLEENSLLVIDIGEALPKNLTAGSLDPIHPFLNSATNESEKIDIPILPERHKDFLILKNVLGNKFKTSNLTSTEITETEIKNDRSKTETSEESEQPNWSTELYEAIAEARKQGILLRSQHTPVDQSFEPKETIYGKLPNIRMRLSSETNSSFLNVEQTVNEEAVCLPQGWLDVSEWGHINGFALGVGDWSTRMMKEFDIIDTGALLGLARHYLHYGFGAEALATLRLLPEVTLESEVLSAVARIIENGYDPEMMHKFQTANCEGLEILWAALSSQELPVSKGRNTADLLLPFANLPLHLQKYLGPILASRLLQAGDPELAESILSNLTNDLKEPSSELELAQAKLSLDSENHEQAIRPLESVVEKNTGASPEALIALIDTSVSRGEAIDQAKVDLAASYMFENRRSPLAKDLSRAYILALAYSDQFEKAFRQILMEKDDSSNLMLEQTMPKVMNRLISHASDREFLLRVLNAAPLTLPSDVENNTARRLLELGFADAASGFLKSPADISEQRARRILRAEIALALSRPLDAEAELLGVEGEDADRLRVQARELAGDYAGALRSVNIQDKAEQRRELAWLAGDWSTLAEGDQDLLAQTAQLAIAHDRNNAENEFDTRAPGFLRQARNLITDSQEARSVLEALLTEFAIDTAENP